MFPWQVVREVMYGRRICVIRRPKNVGAGNVPKLSISRYLLRSLRRGGLRLERRALRRDALSETLYAQE